MVTDGVSKLLSIEIDKQIFSTITMHWNLIIEMRELVGLYAIYTNMKGTLKTLAEISLTICNKICNLSLRNKIWIR